MLKKLILFSLLEDLYSPKEIDEIWNFLQTNQSELKQKGLLEILPKIVEQDRTSAAIFPDRMAFGKIYSKQNGIFSGSDLINETFEVLDPKSEIKILVKNGQKISTNQEIADIKSSLFCLLVGERTVLNFLCHLSGVATKTAEFVNLLKNTKTQLLDSRKTLPGYRNLQKMAVKDGGGQNHRFGLFDQILVKNNHVAAAGSVSLAIQKVLQKWGQKYPILVETQDLGEVREALEFKNQITRIMLDNMDLKTLKKALELIKNQTKTEYTGNVSLENIKKIAETGVDFVSIGGNLTLETYRLDLSMKIE